MERRLATILAADAAGYSRRMAEDEDLAYADLVACRKMIDPLIASHGGRIFGSAGDSVVAEFSSSVHAVECAIEFQKALGNCQREIGNQGLLPFRVGINFGDLIVDEGNLLGDGVNVAARLQSIAPEGGVCLSGNVMEQVSGKIRADFADAGTHRLKNLERPVHVWCWPQTAAPILRRTSLGRRRRRLFAGVLAVAMIAILYLVLTIPHEGAERTERVSIAVMPLDNIGESESQDYFVDGITSDLITDLSKVSGLFVIARDSTFAYKGQAIRPEKIASELGVRYILKGSIRASGDRLRINSQLIDALTGGQIWADRFDREMGEIFALQDDVTSKIVSALKVKLTPDEVARRAQPSKTTPSDAYDYFLKGLSEIRQFTPASTRSARLSFLRALEIDPDYARAYASLAFSYVSNAIFFAEDDDEAAFLTGLNYAQRAIQIEPSLPQGHLALALTYQRLGRRYEALASAKAALRYDPNYSDGYAALAAVQGFLGDGADAERNMRLAMSLNPRFSSAYTEVLGRAKFVQHHYDEALEIFRNCVKLDPQRLTCRVYLAALLGLMGHKDDAEWEAQEVRVLSPGFALAGNIIVAQFELEEHRDLLKEGLRSAGF